MTNTGEINIPKHLKFAFGGLAGIGATCVVQPLDLVKNRMQTGGVGGASKKYKTSLHAIRGIISNEGFFSLYTGLSAGILRQATYTTTRLGVFTWLSEQLSKDGKQSNFVQKVAVGMTAGMIGAFVGTPSEVALIRMTLDASLPMKERRNYKNVLHALFRIVRDEGTLALWRGAIPTMGRSMVVNGVQLSTYEQTKQMLLESGYFRDGVLCQFSSAMVSGLFTTATSLPVDITKTRIQNMKIVNGVAEYSGIVDVFTKIVRNEGFFALWKGFTPYYARLGPHTVLTFLFFEQLKQAYRNSA